MERYLSPGHLCMLELVPLSYMLFGVCIYASQTIGNASATLNWFYAGTHRWLGHICSRLGEDNLRNM